MTPKPKPAEGPAAKPKATVAQAGTSVEARMEDVLRKLADIELLLLRVRSEMARG